jgi:hypothetical protein
LTDITSFDKQLADMLWIARTALMAGFNLSEIFEGLAEKAPEPTRSVCAQVSADLKSHLSLALALKKWQESVPSKYLPKVVEIILDPLSYLAGTELEGGDLAMALERLSDKIYADIGSDKAFYPEMRNFSEQVGAKPPQRVQES